MPREREAKRGVSFGLSVECPRGESPDGSIAGLESQFRHGDVAAEADFDIASWLAGPAVVIAVVMKDVGPRHSIAEGQRPRVERAVDDARFSLGRNAMRQIHVPEGARPRRTRQELAEDAANPARGAGPVDFVALLAVMGEGDARPPEKGRLAGGGDRA